MKLACQCGIKVTPHGFKHSGDLRRPGLKPSFVYRRFYKDMNPRGLEKKSNFELLE